MIEIAGVPYLTTSEVADCLSVSVKTVRNWAYAGRLHAVHRAGIKESLFPKSEVDALLTTLTPGKKLPILHPEGEGPKP